MTPITETPYEATKYQFEALMNALVAFARAGGRGPTEIHLRTRDYVWLAADLGICDPAAHVRVAYDPADPLSLVFAPTTPFSERHHLREVRVGDAFVFQGPCGPVTIRETKEHRNG